MEFEEVHDIAALERIVPEWSQLFRTTPSATPFQSPAWVLAWWKYFGVGKLAVQLLRRNGKLVGVLPLYLGGPGGRMAFFIGQGISDYLDGLFFQPFEQEVADKFVEHVTNCDAFDHCELTQLPTTSPLLRGRIQQLALRRVTPATSCYSLDLPETVEQWRTQMPRNMRQNLRYYQRRSERDGATHFEMGRPENFERLLNCLFLLHAKRWQSQGTSGVLTTDALHDFHREVTGLLSPSSVRLNAIIFRGEVAAVAYAFEHGSRIFFYLTGMDPNTAQYSFGSQLLNKMVEDAIHSGCKQFDLLRGDEAYKRHFGATEQPAFSLTLSRKETSDSQLRRSF